ncbi:type II toxin-antitoxin system YafQ family toxin [Helicobacter suis]|uniref:Type II toxin-antitoxin system mRNA interferase toxin, RelE/StbE family n=1 Tax=Helicobacter suis TaxID=104628 RepID=A0A6J4D1W6_9HELI|nr:type II toxin-antitoxin system YafQ family toxin [Helicobacter suis]BCD46704.1 type II toxin-antitoxin system mRNA interferase toxin, RelE/StbE family [Helicobacter suis]BCD47389.1 type II toxin-antitoxin system mRNA interferase toxin, RelE/StbE family [Helicobacter suis]BCD49143.1 type II toxin-antitoxin system mRNA interferase toxin, RelE/StbE family [Helicobacter suis]BCD51174.1 type II toxin-antitoxin system mRNA interferase toxin, RelE/StbE family [Helicobacter suis]BCD71033.1 type II 
MPEDRFLVLKLIVKRSFKKDRIRCLKNKKITEDKLSAMISKLQEQTPLEVKHKNHVLKQWKNCKECHIEPDLLLLYQIQNDTLILSKAVYT